MVRGTSSESIHDNYTPERRVYYWITGSRGRGYDDTHQKSLTRMESKDPPDRPKP